MSCIRTCFNHSVSAGLLILLLMPACRTPRKVQTENRIRIDSFRQDSSLWLRSVEADAIRTEDWEIVRTEFFRSDSNDRRRDPPIKSVTLARNRTRNTAQLSGRAVRQTGCDTRTILRQESAATSAPGRDPRKWRYIFYTICLIGLLLAGAFVRKKFR